MPDGDLSALSTDSYTRTMRIGMRRHLQRMFGRFVADSIKQKIELEAIDTTLGTGLFAVFNDRKYLEGAARPPAEFITMTTGLIWHSRVIVNYTILTNGEDSPSRAMAQNVVGGFSVFGDLPAAQ